MKNALADLYDGLAATYDQNRGRFDMTEVFEDFYRRLPRPPGEVLDLGCGAGEPFAAAFMDRGWLVTGVDFSPGMLRLAARHVPGMRTLYADMRTVAFAPGRFDAITLIYALFHVPRDDQTTLFADMFSWLKPEGRALFTYATEEYTGQPAFDGHKEFLGQTLYYSHKTPESLYRDLQQIGFVIEARDYREIGGETFLWVTVAKPPL